MKNKVFLSFKVDEHGFTLEDRNYPENLLHDDEETEAEYPEAQLLVDKENRVRFLDFEFIGLNDEKVLEDFSQYITKRKYHGLYIVPQLGLEDVPFEKVIEAVKKKILKRQATVVS